MPKIMLMGYGRHGKDTAAEYLRDRYGLKIANSSLFVAEKAVYPLLAPLYNYSSLDECYNDRHNHRQEWFEAIKAYNTPDLARMSREIFNTNDIYVGIRNADEFLAAKEQKVFEHSVWIDAEKRIGTKESDLSCTVKPEMAQTIVNNNSAVENMYNILDRIMLYIE